MNLHLQDSFNKELSADPETRNSPRQVLHSAYSFVEPYKPSSPKLIHVSQDLAAFFDLNPDDKEFTSIFSGSKLAKGSHPYSMCYGGHQFGHWAGQLGDGRAINLFELEKDGLQQAFQLKGSGPTPYSRSGDGFAVLRSSIREHLISEAMYHLGVPTTRSLCLMLTGDRVLRDMMYDGHPAYEKGAIICRVAESFMRFGNFQIFAARKDLAMLSELCEYTIKHFFPHIRKKGKEGILQFFAEVVQRTEDLMIHWERVGFVHGVMNTDNMSILGLTIDYGPYGWLEDYNPNWTPNTTDAAHKRYRFGAQAKVALWNLAQLANALYPLVGEVKPLEETLNRYSQTYDDKHYEMMLRKLGLPFTLADRELVDMLKELMLNSEMDYTLFFRTLSNTAKGDHSILSKLMELSYATDFSLHEEAWEMWIRNYYDVLSLRKIDDTLRLDSMKKVNPKYVLRNYMAQLAIDAADEGNYGLIEEIYQMLRNPYDEQPEYEKWFAKRPDWAIEKVGCSMLSCSS